MFNLFKKRRESAPEILLSKNISLSTDTKKTRRNCNVFVTGATQRYRNAHYVLPNLSQPTGSYIIMDDTDEEMTIQDMTEQTFRNHGYDIKVFGIRHPENSLKYNPFNYIREDADILTMVDAITKNMKPASPEPSRTSAALLRAICFYLYKECQKSEQNLANIAKLLQKATLKNNSPDYKFTTDVLVVLDNLFEDLKKKDPNHIAVQEYAKFKEEPAKLAPGILNGWLVYWSFIQLDAVKELTSTDQLDLASVGLKPTVLYIKYSSRNPSWSYPILPILLTQLFDTLYHTAETSCARGTLPHHARVFLNNHDGTYGIIPALTDKMSTMRPYNISCDILVDDWEDFWELYRDDKKVIAANCDTSIHLVHDIADKQDTIRQLTGPMWFMERGFFSETPPRPYNPNGTEEKKVQPFVLTSPVKKLIKRCPANIKKGVAPMLSVEEIESLQPGDCAIFMKGCVPLADKVLDAPSNYSGRPR